MKAPSRRPAAPRRSAALAILCLVAGAAAPTACSRAPVEVPRVDPPRDASAPLADPPVDATPPSPGVTKRAPSLLPAVLPKGVAAWTDPAALAVLAVDCRAEPAPHGDSDRAEPLSCSLPFDQSCSYDPCFTKNEDCRAACGTTCQTCDLACVTTCGTCKDTCKDEACTKACAAKTGACRQACLLTRDTCASAGCAEKDRVCYAVAKREWRAHGCSCKAIHPCLQGCFDAKARCEERCANSKDDSCWAKCDSPKCKDSCRARFRGCDVDYCAMVPLEPFQEAP